MDLTLVRSLWGIDLPWEDAFPRIRAAGYTAVEAPIPPASDHPRFAALLEQHGLGFVAMVFTEGATVAEHLASFRSQIASCDSLHPRQITSHSGRDAWDEADAATFFTGALATERELAVPVAHETHRGRILYTPWATRRWLDRFADLRLCCDFSHWVVVCERLLDTEDDIVRQAAGRCIHLHARVGYEEGPQVPNPAAPEVRRPVEAHERWWDIVWDAQAARGDAATTLTPEYGPPDYLHTVPFTRVPLADLWDVCDAQAERQAARFRARFGEQQAALG